jgi:alpha/beta superfamily hydrolase
MYIYAIVVGIVLVLLYVGLVRLKHYILYVPHRLSEADSRPTPENTVSTFVRTSDDTDMLSVVQSTTGVRTIFSHGNYGNLTDYYPLFSHIDKLLMWDYRGFGRSTGKPHEKCNCLDLMAIVDASGLSAENLVLMGHSLGTNVTMSYLDYAIRHQKTVPQRIILIHPFFRLSDVVKHHFNWLAWIAHLTGNMDVTDTVQQYLDHHKDNHLYILYTTYDRVTPSAPVLEAVRNLQRVTLVEVGGEHHSITQNDKIFEAIKNILSDS